jgi:hypothetical protein
VNGVLAGRAALLAVAVVAGRRGRGRGAALLAGAAGTAAAFGPGPLAHTDPLFLGAGLLVAALLLALLRADVHSPLASEAASATSALCAGTAAVAALVHRGAGLEPALLCGAALGAGLSVHGAEGCRANAEAGWRRGLGWASAVLLPGPVAGGLVALGGSVSGELRYAVPAAAVLVALLAWVLPFLLERRRVFRELAEEARLGILPGEDLSALGNPWRRLRESRFGRADERREYVRSALLLAVARQQQKRRTGEANRLRQLEVLAFRTRVRRAVEGRLPRFAAVSDEPAL